MGRGLHRFSILLIALLCAMTLVPTSARAEDDEAPAGYWKLVGTKVDKKDDEHGEVYTDTYTASELSHTHRMTGIYEEDGHSYVETSSFTATCSAAPAIVEGGDRCTFTITLALTENSDKHFHFRESCYVRRDIADMGIGGVYRGYVDFGATKKDAPDGCEVWAIGDWGAGPKRETSTEVFDTFPNHDSDQCCVYFSGCGAQTVWTYEWHDGTVAEEDEQWEFGEHVSEGTTLYTKADEDPGSATFGIMGEIVEGFDPTEGGLYVVAAVATAVIGGVAYTRYKRRRARKSDRQKQDKEQEKKQRPSSYRMVFSKDFGNKLRRGVEREVRVRIEELKPTDDGGQLVIPNPEMTAAIDPAGKQNLTVVRASFAAVRGTDALNPVYGDRDMVVTIMVPKATDLLSGGQGSTTASTAPLPADVSLPRLPRLYSEKDQLPPILSLKYTGKGGTFENQISFQLMDDPEIVFVDRSGAEIARDIRTMDLLMDDAMGTELFLFVRNVASEPKADELKLTPVSSEALRRRRRQLLKRKRPGAGLPAGQALSTACERYPRLDRDGAFAYRVVVRNSVYEPSAYGSWPIDDYGLKIALERPDLDEYAEAELATSIWPEGISFDTSNVKQEWLRSDHIVVDTGDYADTTREDYRIAPAEVGLIVAYKDERGDVRVTTTDQIAFCRLTAADTTTFDLFNAADPRFWYDLRMSKRPAEGCDERMGSLVLQPLFPLVTANPKTEYRGTCELHYNESGQLEGPSLTASIHFGITGISDADFKRERDAEIKAIFRLLERMKMSDMSFASSIFEQYGPETETIRRRLGSLEERDSAAKTATQMMREITQIQSVQRLRFIRKALYEEAAWYCEGEGDKIWGMQMPYQSMADTYNKLFWFTQTARWGVDIAFVAWWYAALGTKAAYVEPVMSPLKDWVLKYFEQVGLGYADEDELLRAQVFEEYFCDYSNWYLTVFSPAAEGELLTFIGNGLSGLGWRAAISPTMLMALGATLCFFFVRGCVKRSKHNEKTGKADIDLYTALKDAMKDFTAFGVKAVLAALIALFFKGNGASAAKTVKSIGERASKIPGLDKLANTKVDLGSYLRLPKWTEMRFSLGQLERASVDMGVVEAFVTATAQKPADVVNDANKETPTSAEGSFDAWVKGLGQVEVGVRGADDKLEKVSVPYLTAAALLVDEAFEKSGLETLGCLQVDFGAVLPEEPTYRNRKELIEGFQRMRAKDNRGAEGEERFLTLTEVRERQHTSAQ